MTIELTPAIAFGGDAYCGKDTAANFLVKEYGYKRLAFGDPLKVEAFDQLFSPDQDFIVFMHRNRQMEDAYRACHRETGAYVPALSTRAEKIDWINENKVVLRKYLQLYGTEYRRRQDPDYWVNLAASQCHPGERYVFTDYRFENEGLLALALGGFRCIVRRPGLKKQGVEGHDSEKSELLPREVDIWNTSTLEILRRFVLALARV